MICGVWSIGTSGPSEPKGGGLCCQPSARWVCVRRPTGAIPSELNDLTIYRAFKFDLAEAFQDVVAHMGEDEALAGKAVSVRL